MQGNYRRRRKESAQVFTIVLGFPVFRNNGDKVIKNLSESPIILAACSRRSRRAPCAREHRQDIPVIFERPFLAAVGGIVRRLERAVGGVIQQVMRLPSGGEFHLRHFVRPDENFPLDRNGTYGGQKITFVGENADQDGVPGDLGMFAQVDKLPVDALRAHAFADIQDQCRGIGQTLAFEQPVQKSLFAHRTGTAAQQQNRGQHANQKSHREREFIAT